MPGLSLELGAGSAGRTRDLASPRSGVPCSGKWGERDQALGPPAGRQFFGLKPACRSLGALDP